MRFLDVVGRSNAGDVRSVTNGERRPQALSTSASTSSSTLPNGHSRSEVTFASPDDACIPSNPACVPNEQQSITEFTNEYRFACPMAPEMYRRYEDVQLVLEENVDHVFNPLTVNFEDGEIPQGWRQFTHPEGARYFCFTSQKVYTDANILDSRIHRFAMEFITQLIEFVRRYCITLPHENNLVLDIEKTEQGFLMGKYYLVDHSKRVIFWLDKFKANELLVLREVKGVTSLSHIGLEIEAQYWQHCYLFPDCLMLGDELLTELRAALVHAISDGLTSMTSPVPYRTSELEQWLNLIKSFSTTDVAPFSRLMHIFCRHRFRHFHGQPTARLDSDRSIYKTQKRNSWLMVLLSPLLFSVPDGYYRRLDRSYVDGVINQRVWADFWTEISTEWNQLIILGTVVLNANVAFLAIQSVDASSASPGRSAAQLCSYLSVISSIGSILFGLFLNQTANVNPKKAAVNAEFFINSATWTEKTDVYLSGVEKLAILYCTPYLLSMWSILLFLAGFSVMCLKASNVVVVALIGSAWLVIAGVIVWGISNLSVWKRYEWREMSFWGRVVHMISIIPIRIVWPWSSSARPQPVHRGSSMSMRWNGKNGVVAVTEEERKADVVDGIDRDDRV
ncbi:hypothetical protein K435DRAFT_735315 [Dendrothele bispora CBS 962.96]|uniref:WW domain-containing protein n=1 Tax=Dendrothele bispora (strain CBS 962.96) TaxID=1314807 RepID=A0A4S8L054_DENBC|nr:hypothetical protein K435DRAFT_735315 [Dendrothele bispora CBS 962.96]